MMIATTITNHPQDIEAAWEVDNHLHVKVLNPILPNSDENPFSKTTAIEFTNPNTETTIRVAETMDWTQEGLVNTHFTEIQMRHSNGNQVWFSIYQPVLKMLNPDDSFVFDNHSLKLPQNLPSGLDPVIAIRNSRSATYAITQFLCGSDQKLLNQILMQMDIKEDLRRGYANELSIDMKSLLRGVFPNLPYDDEFYKHPFAQLFMDTLSRSPQERSRAWETSTGSILLGFKPLSRKNPQTNSPIYTLSSLLKKGGDTIEITEEFQADPISQQVDINFTSANNPQKLISLYGNSSLPMLTTPKPFGHNNVYVENVPAILGRSATVALLQHLIKDEDLVSEWMAYTGLNPRLLADYHNKIFDDLKDMLCIRS